jgi:hypothetical protein
MKIEISFGENQLLHALDYDVVDAPYFWFKSGTFGKCKHIFDIASENGIHVPTSVADLNHSKMFKCCASSHELLYGMGRNLFSEAGRD